MTALPPSDTTQVGCDDSGISPFMVRLGVWTAKQLSQFNIKLALALFNAVKIRVKSEPAIDTFVDAVMTNTPGSRQDYFSFYNYVSKGVKVPEQLLPFLTTEKRQQGFSNGFWKLVLPCWSDEEVEKFTLKTKEAGFLNIFFQPLQENIKQKKPTAENLDHFTRVFRLVSCNDQNNDLLKSEDCIQKFFHSLKEAAKIRAGVNSLTIASSWFFKCAPSRDADEIKGFLKERVQTWVEKKNVATYAEDVKFMNPKLMERLQGFVQDPVLWEQVSKLDVSRIQNTLKQGKLARPAPLFSESQSYIQTDEASNILSEVVPVRLEKAIEADSAKNDGSYSELKKTLWDLNDATYKTPSLRVAAFNAAAKYAGEELENDMDARFKIALFIGEKILEIPGEQGYVTQEIAMLPVTHGITLGMRTWRRPVGVSFNNSYGLDGTRGCATLADAIKNRNLALWLKPMVSG